jgi:ribonuclease J
VILSSHIIPGNEEMIHRLINRLFQKGADVLYNSTASVHVSGHASQEEQKLLLNLVRPKNFIPIHGELRHLREHAKHALELGIPEERIAAVENGHILSFEGDQIQIGPRVPGGYVYVDGSWVGDAISPDVLRDREKLARTGVCTLTMRYDVHQGELLAPPRMAVRGFAARKAVEEVLEEAQDVVHHAVRSLPRSAALHRVERGVRQALSNFFYRETRNRPEIIVTLLEE